MSLELINAKDRIPVNVLSNGAIRYGRYDANGNLLGYEYMKREDEPIEEGTNINKVLLDLIDNNFLTEQTNRMRIDRYNIPEVEYINNTYNGDLIPKTWNQIIEGTKYQSGDIIIETDNYQGAAYIAKHIFDGNASTMWRSRSSSVSSNIIIDFGRAYMITKMKTYVKTASFVIQGSNDKEKRKTWKKD